MKDKFPELWVANPGTGYRKFGLEGGVLQCFESVQGEDGLFLGEDISFCRRWTGRCAGEIWSCVDETIIHTGTENYIGKYLLKMQMGDALKPLPEMAAPALQPDHARPVAMPSR